jgi:hypothetical protein
MEGDFVTAFVLDLNWLKRNCPSGYRCRTRHPQGLVILSAGSVAKERGRNYENQKRINAGIQASAALPGGIKGSVVNQGSVDDALKENRSSTGRLLQQHQSAALP